MSIFLLTPARGHAQDVRTFFKTDCVACHTIGGGRRVGPNLKDVTKRKDRSWLESFVFDPMAKITGGDAYAKKLVDESNGVMMPKPPGISQELARQLIDLIETESALPESEFGGGPAFAKVVTEQDIDVGRDLFTGRRPLANGGTVGEPEDATSTGSSTNSIHSSGDGATTTG